MRTLRSCFVVALVLLQVVQYSQGRIWKRYIGYCNSQSANCGAGCNTVNDCQGGACWASQDTCTPIGYCNSQSPNCDADCSTSSDCQGGACWASQDTCSPIGYCNSASSNCGAGCHTNNDCQGGGGCWADQDTCPSTTYAGYCNAASTNCGTPCNIQSDCPGGDCWQDQQTCTITTTASPYAGYCNAASTNCGTPCNIKSDCPGGDCWAVFDPSTCSTTTTYTGYCNAASTNCGTPCNLLGDCPGGDCWKNQQTCTTTTTASPYAGLCNADSSNCGTPCNIKSDCPGGDCWAVFDPSTCSTTTTYTGYCNAASTNCGTPCNLLADCPGGDCWQAQQTCSTIPTYTGYCDAASSNCGAGCNVTAECPDGECKNEQESCGTGSGHVIGTYLGALPYGVATPQLSTVPSEVNFILLGFAKDASYNGNFQQFSEWVNQGVTKQSITADKVANPNRKYMVSLGGAADYGGTFGITSGMTTAQWVANADASIAKIVSGLNADGVDIQFEGGTKNAKFPAAITGLAQSLKNRGYIVSFGPYYGGTWSDYVSLPLTNVDYVFCQFYAKNLQTVSSVVSDLTQAKNDLGGWSKLIAGLNSNGRNPNPSIAMQAVERLKANLKGTFTWAAEHSQSNSPAYCIEKNSARILVDNQAAQTCNW